MESTARFFIFEIDDPVPDGGEDLGVVKVYDNGFSTNCGYQNVLKLAETEARKAGGNAMKIVEHMPPSVWGSSCHQIVAQVYWFSDIVNVAREPEVRNITEVHADTSIKVIPAAEVRTNEIPPDIAKGKNYKGVFPKWRIGIGGGYSYRLAQLPENAPDFYTNYLEKLKQGYNLNGDVTYFLSRGIGVGIRYSFSHTSNSMSDIVLEFEDPDTTLTGDMADNISVHFIGPAFSMRSIGKKNDNAFFMNFSVGYLHYINKCTLIYDFTITGGTVGIGIDIGYDFAVSKNLAFGLQLSMIGGSLKKITFDYGGTKETVTLDKESYEGLGRIDVGVLLRFRR